MVELEINGKKVEVPEGSMVMEAAEQLGVYVPHFCFHKKLSIAANCRMCLVEIEKTRKPMPACATPVNQGMKVFTNSQMAKKAQQGVMEFLLINHPLDCPVCDQGGECQLQDLAVGYGSSNSRFTEEKRVVFQKNMGPLISAEEMSRCIHCTRCIRFGQEVAGVMELGMPGRGEHSEITTFVGKAVESELSGNMIDICPVGALTSKPFRFTARTWELERYKTISPHDGMGTNIIAQTNAGIVARVVPFENHEINECWISDRDRFSYLALNSDDRLLDPMIKDQSGNWNIVSWREALEKSARIIENGRKLGKYGLRGIASPNNSTEEFLLFRKLIKQCGSDSIDFRNWLNDENFDENITGFPNLSCKLKDLSNFDTVFIIGSRLRDDFPLLAQKIRVAVNKNNMNVLQLGAFQQDLLMKVDESILEKPSKWSDVLNDLLQTCTEISKNHEKFEKEENLDYKFKRISKMLMKSHDASSKSLILAGPSLFSHPEASSLLSLLKELSDVSSCELGCLPQGANNLGGYLSEAIPTHSGYSLPKMFDDRNSAFILLNIEPSKDFLNAKKVVNCLKASTEGVIALTAFKSSVSDVASVMLPISTFAESAGTFVNFEGRVQEFNSVSRLQGASRPAWKVLRVLGNLLGLDDFNYQNLDDVKKEFSNKYCSDSFVKNISFKIDKIQNPNTNQSLNKQYIEPYYYFPIYLSDIIVRRSEALLKTPQSKISGLLMHPETMKKLSLNNGDNFSQKISEYIFPVDFDSLECFSDSSVAIDVIAIAVGSPFHENVFMGDYVSKDLGS